MGYLPIPIQRFLLDSLGLVDSLHILYKRPGGNNIYLFFGI